MHIACFGFQDRKDETVPNDLDLSSHEIAVRTRRMLGGFVEPPFEPRLEQLLNTAPRDSSAVEFGCWHGWHTIHLARHFNHVTAIDARPDNLSLALLRANLLGIRNVDFVLTDVDDFIVDTDILVHIGVLYHLRNPVRHLMKCLAGCKTVCLDTHTKRKDQEPAYEEVDGKVYAGGLYQEFGLDDPLSGIQSHSLWLEQDFLMKAIAECGFCVTYTHPRDTENGPRITIIAKNTRKF